MSNVLAFLSFAYSLCHLAEEIDNWQNFKNPLRTYTQTDRHTEVGIETLSGLKIYKRLSYPVILYTYLSVIIHFLYSVSINIATVTVKCIGANNFLYRVQTLRFEKDMGRKR